MARDFVKASGNFLGLGAGTGNALLNGAARISLHAWIRPDSFDTGSQFQNDIIAFYVNGTSHGVLLNVNASATNPNGRLRIQCQPESSEGFEVREGGTDIVAGNQYAAGASIDLTGDRMDVYLDGVNDGGGAEAFTATAYTPGSPARDDAIGADRGSGTPSQTSQFDGRIAEVAVWTEDIGSDGFAQLAKGFSPLLVRPEALVFYMPLLGFGADGPEIDLAGGYAGTITGTIAIADHPRVYYPALREAGLRVPVVAGGWPGPLREAFVLPALTPGLIS
jgi:hypothetical protein